MSNFTPKPWFIARNDNFEYLIQSSDQDTDQVAVTYKNEDAHLITQAPDLLESLESALIALTNGCESEDDKQGLITQIETVILKAQGKYAI